MARADPGATWGEPPRMQLVSRFLAQQPTLGAVAASARTCAQD
jgi:hypothetical protein